ncbi:unnamed protein product, partial [Nesidiocoris tenuis]
YSKCWSMLHELVPCASPGGDLIIIALGLFSGWSAIGARFGRFRKQFNVTATKNLVTTRGIIDFAEWASDVTGQLHQE